MKSKFLLILLLLFSCAPKVTAAESNVSTELEKEVSELVNAGHLRPGYFVTGFIDDSIHRDHGDQMGHYFHNPADTIYTLTRALPHLSSALATKTRAYIQSEYQNYPLTTYTTTGWRDGANRDDYLLPPVVTDAFSKTGPGSYSPFPAWSFHPFNFYAAAKYAKEFGGASTIFSAIKNKLNAPPADSLLLDLPHALNVYIAGYMGYLELEQLAGQPKSTAVENTLNRLLQLRLNHLDTVNPANIRGSEAGGFIYLVPELGSYLYQNRQAKVLQVVNTYNDIMPYWFVAKADEQIRDERTNGNYSEGSTTHLHAYHSLFSAKALALKQSRSELEKYLDIGGFETGDLFYIQNLVYTLEAGGVSPTIPPTTPTSTPVPGITSTPVPGSLISNLTVYDTANAFAWSIQSNLQSGNTQYNDRTYTWNTVPSLVAGSQWIRTANLSRSYTGSPVATFSLTAPATVYIAFDDRYTEPSWMSGYTDTGQDMVNSEPNPYSLYSASYSSPQTISLGPVGSGSYGMYSVIVKASSVPGDGNGDGHVNGVDYMIWYNHYKQSVSGPANGDYNSSGYVDGVDYMIWLTNYGR